MTTNAAQSFRDSRERWALRRMLGALLEEAEQARAIIELIRGLPYARLPRGLTDAERVLDRYARACRAGAVCLRRALDHPPADDAGLSALTKRMEEHSDEAKQLRPEVDELARQVNAIAEQHDLHRRAGSA